MRNNCFLHKPDNVISPVLQRFVTKTFQKISRKISMFLDDFFRLKTYTCLVKNKKIEFLAAYIYFTSKMVLQIMVFRVSGREIWPNSIKIVDIQII